MHEMLMFTAEMKTKTSQPLALKQAKVRFAFLLNSKSFGFRNVLLKKQDSQPHALKQVKVRSSDLANQARHTGTATHTQCSRLCSNCSAQAVRTRAAKFTQAAARPAVCGKPAAGARTACAAQPQHM